MTPNRHEWATGTPSRRRRGHRTVWRLCAGAVATTLAIMAPLPSRSATSTADPAKTAAAGTYVTLLFSRGEVTAADGCVRNDGGIARLDTVIAPYLASRGMAATGTLTTDATKQVGLTCTHYNASLTTSWNIAGRLADQYGWSFVSHTATYPKDILNLPPSRANAETCGSAETIDQHGLPGAHGMIAYPGAQNLPQALQRDYASRCFAWGRKYGAQGLTYAADGLVSPYWQRTVAPKGGPCNVRTQPCYTIAARDSARYRVPAKTIGYVHALRPGMWFTLQAYVLVTGTNPAYSHSSIRWDCRSSDPRLHWTTDNERYCYQDWQAVVDAIADVPNVTVTDPLTVGIAFGRPATYP
jgi:hypothetical protein